MKGSAAVLLLCAGVAGCGDKLPESPAAKAVGAAPKQVMDKAVNDTARSLEQGESRSREAPEKAEK